MLSRLSDFAGPLSSKNVSNWTFRYFKFQVNATRGISAGDAATYPNGMVQLAEFEMMFVGTKVNYTGITATNPGGAAPAGQGPNVAVDGDETTVWIDWSGNDSTVQPRSYALVLDFGSPRTVDSFRFKTAADVIERDPTKWVLSGSTDNSTWRVLHTQATDASITTSRRTYTQLFYLNRGGA